GLLAVAVVVILGSSAVYLAGSAVAPDLSREWGLSESEASAVSAASQAGFIVGTLVAAALNLPDRVGPGRLAALLLVGAGAANAALLLFPGSLPFSLLTRFLVGALSGPVYPLAMKVLATWTPRLGPKLGILLAFSTLGYGSGFLLRALSVPWEAALLGTTLLALLGAAVAQALLRPGPLLPAATRFSPRAAALAFREPAFRASALSYFGHMWELVAFWALLPFWLTAAGYDRTVVLGLAGGVFVTGALGCLLAARLSLSWGEARVARAALATSGVLCLASPLLFGAPLWVTAPLVLLWGAAVIADSAMYSALSARAAPREYVGTALTVQNGLGFALTIVTLALVPAAAALLGSWQYALALLAVGPILGLLPLRRLMGA
ncbi:MAG TPA: MFS transporter, partial [Candidatus Thermoplasmatota archaeon]|nr:MFS transporter [Candidatus Thermoplasmatota archaeon]